MVKTLMGTPDPEIPRHDPVLDRMLNEIAAQQEPLPELTPKQQVVSAKLLVFLDQVLEK